MSLRQGEHPRGVVFRSAPRPLSFFFSLLLACSGCKLGRTGCDRRRRFVWNLPQFGGKGIRHVCVSVSRDNGGGPLLSSFLLQGIQPVQGFHLCYTMCHHLWGSGDSGVDSGDNMEMTWEMGLMMWIWEGNNTYQNAVQSCDVAPFFMWCKVSHFHPVSITELYTWLLL